MSGLKGKTGFVTGAGSGIGRATAEALAREGVNLMIVDINATGLEETRELVEKLGVRVATSVTDISDAKAVEKTIADTITQFGRLDVAHNNAAIMGSIGPMADYDLAEARKLFDVNVFGLLHCLQPQIRHMKERGGGAIVNTASVSGVHAVPHIGIYTATKHAVIGLTKAAAADYSGAGIRINCVCPGFVMTNMTAGRFDKATEDALAAQHPIGRFAQAEEIANAVVWLLSDKASFSTGSAVFVDGGQTL
jgi:NAD(P)-dependent dehydrogenase (short-subunit alcohol dehydrogenase family)